MSDYLKDLEEINNNFYNRGEGSDVYSIDSFNEGMMKYSTFIKSFFKRDEAGDKIRNIYIKLRNGDLDGKIIDTYDINFASKAFLDYIGGMKEFILNLIHAEEGEKDKYREQLTTAENTLQTFLSKIFGGDLNKTGPTPLKDAVSNLEVLVDIVDSGDSIVGSSNCDEICDSDETLCKEAKKLFYNAVKLYYYNLIKGIIETYEKINNVLDNEEPSKEKEVEFKLF